MKKVLSILIVLTMLLSCMCVPVYAALDPTVIADNVFTSDESSVDDYNVTSGYKLNDSNGIEYPWGKTGSYDIIAKEKTTGNDFLMQYIMQTGFNNSYAYFNYVDSKNYSAIYFMNPLKVVNVSDGKATEVYSKADSTNRNGVRRTVKLSRSNGMLKLIENDKLLFENVEDENAINGKFGVKFVNSVGYLKSIKVSDLLHITDINVSEKNTHRISDDIFAMFDYALEADTVNTDNVYLTTESGKVDTDTYSVSQNEDNQIVISFSEPLKYDTAYTLVLSERLYVQNSDHGFCEDKEIRFATEPYPFTSQLKTEAVDDGIETWVEIENNFYSEKDVYTLIEGTDSDGRTVDTIIPEKLTVNDVTASSQTVTLPEAAENISHFVWDEKMHKAFPEITDYPNSDDFSAEVLVTGDNVKISGVVPSAESGKTVTFIMGNVDEAVSLDAQLSKASQAVSTDDGAFIIEFPVSNADVSGTYSYMIGGDDFKNPYENSFYYASAYDKNEIVKDINAVCVDSELTDEEKIQQIAGVIQSNEDKLTLNSELYKAVDVNDIAGLILNKYSDGEFNEEDGAVEFRRVIDVVSIISAYNSGKTDVLTDAELNFTNEDIYSFNEYDEKNKTTASEVYKDLSQQAKQAVLDAVTNNSYTDIEEIYSDFVRAVVVNAVKGIDGTGHIRALLESNAEFCGMNIQGYFELKNTGEIDARLADSEFVTISELEALINSMVEGTDSSIINYDFSQSNKSINWEIINETSTASFGGEKLTLSSVSSMGIITKDKYSSPVDLSVTLYYHFNQARVIFAYQDSKNYCYIEYNGGAGTVKKVVDGTTEEIKAFSNPVSSLTYANITTLITVKPDSKIDAKLIKGDVEFALFNDLQDEAFAKAGGFGAQMVSATGNISKVEAREYPTVKESNINDEFLVNSNAEFEFNHALNADTVNSDSVTVKDRNGNEVLADVSLNDNKVILDFIAPLEYKQKYTVTFDKSITLKNRSCQMMDDESYSFKTQNSPIDIINVFAVVNNTEVYKEDTTFTNGDVTECLKQYGGENVDVYVEITNKTSASGAILILSLVDQNGKIRDIKNVNIALPTGEASSTETVALKLPSDVADGYRIEYMIIEASDSMKLLYPYSDMVQITSGSKTLDYTLANDVLTVSGMADDVKAGGKVGIAIYSPDGAVTASETAVTDVNGKYIVNVPINYSLFAQSGDYTVKASGKLLNGVKSTTVYIANPDAKKSAIAEINDSLGETQMLGLITKHTKALGFDSFKKSGTDNPFNIIDKSELAKLMQNRIDSKDMFETDSEEINEFVILTSLICAYNQGLSDYLYGKDGEFLASDILNFTEADTGKINAYSIYESSLTDAGRKAVRDGLLNGKCESKADLIKLFIQQVIISAVNNYKEDGYGHINGLLLNNGEAAGLNLTKYKKLSKTADTDIKICRANVKTIDDINKILKNITTDSNNEGGGGTPGVGGSSNGFGSGGGAKGSNVNVVTNQTVAGFADMNGFEWASEAVKTLNEKGIISGRGNNSFDPSGKLTREEFAKILVLAFNLKSDEAASLPFEDINGSEWFAEYVKAAYSSGIIKGVSDSHFGTGATVTRQDAATMLYRALNAESSDDSVLDSYQDGSKTADYAREAISYMINSGYMNGVNETTLAPTDITNRAQIAVLVYRIIK